MSQCNPDEDGTSVYVFWLTSVYGTLKSIPLRNPCCSNNLSNPKNIFLQNAEQNRLSKLWSRFKCLGPVQVRRSKYPLLLLVPKAPVTRRIFWDNFISSLPPFSHIVRTTLLPQIYFGTIVAWKLDGDKKKKKKKKKKARKKAFFHNMCCKTFREVCIYL